MLRVDPCEAWGRETAVPREIVDMGGNNRTIEKITLLGAS
jgi:hypothetical protein